MKVRAPNKGQRPSCSVTALSMGYSSESGSEKAPPQQSSVVTARGEKEDIRTASTASGLGVTAEKRPFGEGLESWQDHHVLRAGEAAAACCGGVSKEPRATVTPRAPYAPAHHPTALRGAPALPVQHTWESRSRQRQPSVCTRAITTQATMRKRTGWGQEAWNPQLSRWPECDRTLPRPPVKTRLLHKTASASASKLAQISPWRHHLLSTYCIQ